EQAFFREPVDLQADVVVAPVADAGSPGLDALRPVRGHHPEIELHQAIMVLVVAKVDSANAGIAVDQVALVRESRKQVLYPLPRQPKDRLAVGPCIEGQHMRMGLDESSLSEDLESPLGSPQSQKQTSHCGLGS